MPHTTLSLNTPRVPSKLATRLRQGLMVAVAFAGLAYASLLAGVYGWQERLLFHPVPLPAAYRLAAAPGVSESTVTVPGARLSVAHLRLPSPKGVVFFLHGNSGNLDTWFTSTEIYRQANFDLVMMDYRGFGKSTGTITDEAQLRADVRAVWRSVAPEYAGKRRVVYGRSLGTGLAAGLAAELQPELTILVSPYCSITELAHEHYPLVPSALLRYPLDTCADVARLRAPLLLVHGEADRLIPIHHSDEVAHAAPQASLLRLPGAGHGDVHTVQAYRARLLQALDAL